MTLTLEAGKFYRTRDGRRLGPYTPHPSKDIMWVNGDHQTARYMDGRVNLSDTDADDDLIAEWPEDPAFNPLDAVKLASLYASTKRLADAAERIATALETLAANTAPALNPLQPMPAYIDALNKATKPDAAGWIEWHGGECPVRASVLVDYETSDHTDVDGYPAGQLIWEHGEDGVEDILKYRVHK